MGEEYSSFGRISMLYAVCLTSGLHGPRVRLIMPKHFEDFEVMSVALLRTRIYAPELHPVHYVSVFIIINIYINVIIIN